MIVVVQRVSEAKVTVDGKTVGEIGHGLLLLVGISRTDSKEDADYLSEKIVHLRIFNDEKGKMNRSLLDTRGAILSVSQFTLLASTRKGRRPSFIHAAEPAMGEKLYQYFNEKLRSYGIHLQTGIFGAMMQVHLVNEGPVTIILNSEDRLKPREAFD